MSKQTKRWELCQEKQGMICGGKWQCTINEPGYMLGFWWGFCDGCRCPRRIMFFCGSRLHFILRNREIDKNWIRNEFGVLVFRFKQGSRSTASAEIHVYMTWYILVDTYIRISLYSYIHIHFLCCRQMIQYIVYCIQYDTTAMCNYRHTYARSSCILYKHIIHI